MITPKFSCSQTDTSVIVKIYVPSVRAADVEIHVDDTLLSVHINPYFLRLTFPGRVQEDDESAAQYDPGSGYLTVNLTKETPGEEFKDLDILAKLLAPKRVEPTQPTIEVVGSSEDAAGQNVEDELVASAEKLSLADRELLEAAENDWQLPQQLPDSQTEFQTTSERRYGFLDLYTGYFRHVAHTENEINELGEEVETMLVSERRKRRIAHEEQKWDEEHYMADCADDEYIQELISFQFSSDAPSAQTLDEQISFTPEEDLQMLRLPQKEYLPTPEQTHNLYHTLITLLFAYAYDARTTQHEPTPESAWTICSLTPAFSALDPPPYGEPLPLPFVRRASSPSSSVQTYTPEELHDTIIASIRRSLALPLYRSFALAQSCALDVATILLRGKRAVLRALLETKRILDAHEVYYVYNKVWVDDFCVWVAKSASEDVLGDLGQKLKTLRLDKNKTGWDLVALEEAVRSQLSRESDSDDESGSEPESDSDSD